VFGRESGAAISRLKLAAEAEGQLSSCNCEEQPFHRQRKVAFAKLILPPGAYAPTLGAKAGLEIVTHLGPAFAENRQ